MKARAKGPGFASTVILLLDAARRRTTGRLRRSAQLGRRRGARVYAWISIASILTTAALINLIAASVMGSAVSRAVDLQVEANGRVIVEEWFAGRTEQHEAGAAKEPVGRGRIDAEEESDIVIEASRLASSKRDEATIADRLRAIVRKHPAALISRQSLWWQPGALPDIVALVVLLWWSFMLVCQREASLLDMLRARRPTWEWLLTHPAPPGAILLAEMIAPIVTDPLLLTAPLFPGVLFGATYGVGAGILAAALVGMPCAVAFACLGKAIEIAITSRLSARARRVTLGFLGWFGLALAVLFWITPYVFTARIVGWAAPRLLPAAGWSWPSTRLLIGRTIEDYELWRGIGLCALLAAVVTVAAVAIVATSARYGLVRRPEAAADPPRVARS